MASENVLATSLTLGTIASGLLAYLKSAKWAPWFSQHSKTLNHVVLLATSAGSALGISATWDATAHTLTIAGLSLPTIIHGGWEWMKQWCVQYMVHRGIFGPVSSPGDAPPIPVTPVAAEPAKP